MGIPSISAVASSVGVAPTTYLANPLTGAVSGAQGSSTTESDFSSTLTQAVDQLQGAQAVTQNLAMQAMTGELDDIHDYTVAAAKSSVLLEVGTALKNQGVNAFNEIMRVTA